MTKFANRTLSELTETSDFFPNVSAIETSGFCFRCNPKASENEKDTEAALCFICKEDAESSYHFFLDCPQFKENFDFVGVTYN